MRKQLIGQTSRKKKWIHNGYIASIQASKECTNHVGRWLSAEQVLDATRVHFEPCLLALVMESLIAYIKNEAPWSMLFAADVTHLLNKKQSNW